MKATRLYMRSLRTVTGMKGFGKRELGGRSERVAAEYLRRMGLRILEVNHRCRLGEIDIVAREGRTMVFVEVKSKGGPAYGRPEEMITAAKRRKLTALALAYIRKSGWRGRPARFDVVTILWLPDGMADLRHHRSAFQAEGAW